MKTTNIMRNAATAMITMGTRIPTAIAPPALDPPLGLAGEDTGKHRMAYTQLLLNYSALI